MYVLPVIYNIVRRFLLGALRSVGLCPVKPSTYITMHTVLGTYIPITAAVRAAIFSAVEVELTYDMYDFS
jgi:hypothetical protein